MQKHSELKIEREDIFKDSQKVAEKVTYINKKGKIAREEYYILESVIEYNKSGKKEQQTTYDSQGNITHKVNYALDGSVVNVINLKE